jgi:hypothetical protein
MKKQELVLPYFNLRKNLNDAPQEKKKEYIKLLLAYGLTSHFSYVVDGN